MEDKRYIYSAARTKVLECDLLHRELFISMASARTLEDALSVLAETGSYPAEVSQIQTSQELDEFINEELSNLYKLAGELFIDEYLLESFKLIKKDIANSYGLILKTKSDFLISFTKKFIDLHNIKSYLRIISQKRSYEQLDRYLVDNGYITKKSYLDNFSKMEFKDYYEPLKDGIEKVKSDNDFSTLERQIEDYIITFLRASKHMCFGPEPIFGYCYAKESELNKIKLIIMSKISKVSQSYIDERLTLSYA